MTDQPNNETNVTPITGSPPRSVKLPEVLGLRLLAKFHEKRAAGSEKLRATEAYQRALEDDATLQEEWNSQFVAACQDLSLDHTKYVFNPYKRELVSIAALQMQNANVEA